MTTERGRRPRRPHAAAGGRLLIGGLSASVLVALIGSMARAERPASTDPPPSVAPTAAQAAGTASPAPAAVPPRPTAPETTGPQAPVVPPTVQVTRPTTPPITTSHAT